jgi:glycosyltransferase involved in cell wall biosynthesis
MSKREKTVRVGMPFGFGDGGPSVFLSRLKSALSKRSEIQIGSFLDPRIDLLLCMNRLRNYWGKPYIVRVDGINFDLALSNSMRWSKNSSMHDALLRADGVIFQSRYCRDLIQNIFQVEYKNSCIIPNGVDQSQYKLDKDRTRFSLKIATSDFVVLTSAKWRVHKRLASTIDAYKKFASAAGQPTRLIVVGEPNEWKSEWEAPDISFVGNIPPGSTKEWYSIADCYLFLSWLDHCPNSVVEAIGAGLPVICSNQGGTKELLERTNSGVVVDADDDIPAGLADLYNPPKPNIEKVCTALLDVLANRNRESVEDRSALDIGVVATHYTDFFMSTLRS